MALLIVAGVLMAMFIWTLISINARMQRRHLRRMRSQRHDRIRRDWWVSQWLLERRKTSLRLADASDRDRHDS